MEKGTYDRKKLTSFHHVYEDLRQQEVAYITDVHVHAHPDLLLVPHERRLRRIKSLERILESRSQSLFGYII